MDRHPQSLSGGERPGSGAARRRPAGRYRRVSGGGLLLLLLALAGCTSPGEAVVEGHYDGRFPKSAHYERLTVQVTTEAGSGHISGRAWLQRGGTHLSIPVVSGIPIGRGDEGEGGESIMLLLKHEGLVSTLYADVGRSGRRLEGVFNGRGGGATISLRRLRTPAVHSDSVTTAQHRPSTP